MNFSSKAQASRRSARVTAALAWVVIGLAAGCGGSSSQQEVFQPKRVLAFGDDDSAITSTGQTYSVNGLDGITNAFSCSLQPNWVQQVAGLYGFVFPECNPGGVAEPQARSLAVAGAKVSDVAAQVEAQVAAGGFRDRDLATVLAGTNDIIELYSQYPGLSEDILIAEAKVRGARLARVVNRLVDLGAKVVVSDLPDLGITPLAAQQNALGLGDRAGVLSRLTTAFNEQLGVNVLLDGRFVGLVQSQLRFQAIARAPAAFGLANITQGVCTVAPPDCTTATLQPGADPGQYLWADNTRLAPGGHAQLATLAVDRARRNPF